MRQTVLDKALDAYWKPSGEVERQDRMKAALLAVSEEVRTWAPDVGQAKICNLAINEVADRIQRECAE